MEEKHVSDFQAWIKKVLASKNPGPNNNIGIFTHKMPDPDAIGSMMGLKWLFGKLDIESECFYEGSIAHPQNMAMCNLLDPGIRLADHHNLDDYPNNIIVDCIPGDIAGVGFQSGGARREINFDVVIDHHKVVPHPFDGVFINLKNGSCCGTVYDLIKSYGLDFQVDNDLDSKVATALMVGIAVDTDNLLADSCTEYEFDAYSGLFELRKKDSLKEIIKYKRPKFWINRKAEASREATIGEDGIAVVGVGLLPEKHFNLIADVADEMISWASVETAICFAVVDGKDIVGSVRSINASVDMNDFCVKLGGKYGSGGGREGKGSYRYGMQGLAIEDDEDEEIKNEMWVMINKKEIKRILRTIKK